MLQSKAIEFHHGNQCENYVNHDETVNSWIEVLFCVDIVWYSIVKINN